jgi:hypothetical protein
MKTAQIREVIGQINQWWMIRHLSTCPYENMTLRQAECNCRAGEIYAGKQQALQLLNAGIKANEVEDLKADRDRLQRENEQLRRGR